MNPQVSTALQRLERAIGRLEAAAAARGPSEDTRGLKDAFDRLTRDHAALKENAGRVAERLDRVIDRVQATLEG